MSKVFDLGAFTAYAIAVEHGYEGTEEEWIEAHERARVEAERSAKSAYDSAVSAGASADVAGSMKNAAVQAAEIAVSAKDSSVQSANEAHASAQSAEVAKNAAETAQRGASVSENNAKSSETAAAKSSADASIFKEDALKAKQGAETARDDAISAKNEAVSSKEQVHSDRVAAENAKTDAETAKTSAEAAQKAAESAKKSVDASVQSVTTMRDEVSTLKQSAFEAKEAAETAKTGAESARDEAVQAKTGAESANRDAVTAKEAAEEAQRLAEGAKSGAESAKTAAEDARDGAVTAKESAESAKTTALGAQSAAETAKSGAETAQGKAETAESNAKTYAGQAETAKSSAETAAQSAGQSATNADSFAKKAQGLVDSLPTDFTAVQTEVSQLKDDLADNANADAETRRKLDYLWKLNQGISYQFETDVTEAYSKTVPNGAKLASVESVGGKTVVWNQLVDSGATSVPTISTRKYVSCIDGTWEIRKSNGSDLAVSDGDIVIDLSRLFGVGNEPTTTDDSRVTWVKQYAAQHPEYNAGELVSTDVESVKYNDAVIGNIPDAVRALPGYGWSAGDVCNSIVRTDNGWQYVQRVGRKAFNGTSWHFDTYGKRFMSLDFQPFKQRSKPYCEIAKFQRGYPDNYKEWMWTLDYPSTDVEEFKAAMSGKYIYGELATPVITDITDMMVGFPTYFDVEAGGTLIFENAAQLPVQSSVEYLVSLAEVNG